MVESTGIVIGVTGHRDVRVDDPWLCDAVHDRIEGLLKSGSTGPVVVLSCLAEGADRLVADIAMSDFQAALVVPLPFAPGDYERDFQTAESRKGFHDFLGRAERWFVVGRHDAEGLDRNWYYACAGAYVVSNCDALIAIWDGQPARGVGGTGELVAWVRQGRIPDAYRRCVGGSPGIAGSVVHINPEDHSVR